MNEITTNQKRDARIRREAEDPNGLSSRGASHRPPWKQGHHECGCSMSGPREDSCGERGLGHPFLLNPKPKDIHEGTLNHLIQIQNQICTDNPIEAGYLLTDLIDQVSSRGLVITQRVEPLDHIQYQQLIDGAHAEGYAKGKREAHAEAVKQVRRELAEALKGVI